MSKTLPGVGNLKFAKVGSSNRSIDIHFEPSIAILAGKIDKLGIDIRSFREPLKRSVKEVMIPSIRKNFDSGGRPSWEPLADSTLARKNSNQTLVESGTLRRTMGYQNVWTITRGYALIKDLPDSVWYGKVHQAGASVRTNQKKRVGKIQTYMGRPVGKASEGGSFNIPARPFVMIFPEDEKKIESIFRHWLQERIIRAGLR